MVGLGLRLAIVWGTWTDGGLAASETKTHLLQVALRLWENPYNKVCGDCTAANPEWASVNLLLVICQDCAGSKLNTSRRPEAFRANQAMQTELLRLNEYTGTHTHR
uniref:Arf-GAP domain-containing protein n=1 Tax=Stegastes partitus TaxID=144197 RepID=A0A3B4ZH82_9TELE